MRSKLFKSIIAFGLLLSSLAFANDGGLSLGGSPRLLKDHPSVVMESEYIKMVIDDGKITVDCSFVFKNTGKACEARMGFPDQGFGERDPDEYATIEEAKKNPPKSTFTSFKSYVDGKEVKTELIRAEEAGKFWHAKMVSFAANQKRRVRDVYTQYHGGQVLTKSYVHTAGYVLHTGASWHGKIGRSEVVIVFNTKDQKTPLKLSLFQRGTSETMFAKIDKASANAAKGVWVSGPVKPRLEKNTLRFVRTQWEPTKADDIMVYFGYRGYPPTF